MGAQVEWVVDSGVSARDGNLKHGRIAQLRADIIAGKRPPGILMADEASRLSRSSIATTLSFLAPLLEAGLDLAVAQRKQVLRRGDDAEFLKLFMSLIESQARTEAAIRRGNLAPGIVYNSHAPDWAC